MSDSFSPKKSINRTTPELFSLFVDRNNIALNVVKSTSSKRYKNNVFFAYLNLPFKDKVKMDSTLFEIHTVANNIGSGEQINLLLKQENITLPTEMQSETVHNQTMWLYLNAPNSWDRISRFAYADKFTSRVWLTTNIVNELDEVPIADNENPDTEKLANEIGERLNIRDGRGRFAQAEYFLRNGKDEYYFIFLDDYNKHKTECRNGQFVHDAINYDSIEAVFVFHRDSRTLEAKLPTGINKNEKMDFCDIWAKCIKNCRVEGIDTSKPLFLIDKVFDPNFEFTQDAEEKMVSARVFRLCMSVLGCPGSKRIYEEKQGNIYEKMEQEINQSILPKKNRIIEYVVIQFVLADEFGRSKTQQLKVSRDGHDILDKNPAVQEVLRDALVRWHIAAA